MKVIFNNEIPRDLWSEFVDRNSMATPFQTPEFFDFFNSLLNLSAIAIAVEHDDELRALTVISIQKENGIKSLFSKRAIVYGGVLIKKGDEEALSLLLNALNKEIKGKAIYAEIRNLNDYTEFRPCFEKEGWQYTPYLNYRVNCADEATIWGNLNRLRKRQVKKAQSNEVIVNVAENISDVHDLYEILHNTYKNKIGKPLFNWDFFRELYRMPFCKVFIIKVNNSTIGGHFCLVNRDVIYDWYGCGLDREYSDYAPSTMIVYSALQYAINHKMKYFDFMGAGTPDKEYGVRDFKAQFGGELVEYGRFIKILKPGMYKIGEFGLRLISAIKK